MSYSGNADTGVGVHPVFMAIPGAVQEGGVRRSSDCWLRRTR
jgi:hypothetical protein